MNNHFPPNAMFTSFHNRGCYFVPKGMSFLFATKDGEGNFIVKNDEMGIDIKLESVNEMYDKIKSCVEGMISDYIDGKLNDDLLDKICRNFEITTTPPGRKFSLEAKKPLLPEILADALQDRVSEVSGKLISSKPVKVNK